MLATLKYVQKVQAVSTRVGSEQEYLRTSTEDNFPTVNFPFLVGASWSETRLL